MTKAKRQLCLRHLQLCGDAHDRPAWRTLKWQRHPIVRVGSHTE